MLVFSKIGATLYRIRDNFELKKNVKTHAKI